MLNLFAFFISVYSLGGFIDPVSNGISLRIRNKIGLHIIGAFGEGEKELYIYENGRYEYKYKPFHWYNIALRGEFFIPPKDWLQPYIVLGIAMKDEENWTVRWVYEKDTLYYKIERLLENYKSYVIAFGLEIQPLKETAKGITFLENLSVEVEFPVIYHKFEYKVEGPWGYSEWDYSDRKTPRSGIGLGIGIHCNF